MIASRSSSAAWVSIFETRRAREPTTSATRSTSSAAHTNDTAMNSTPAAAIVSASTRSSSVGVVSRTTVDDRCTPGCPLVRPPVSTRASAASSVDLEDRHRDRTVPELDLRPGVEIVEQRRVLHVDRRCIARPVAGDEPDLARALDHHVAVAERPGTDLRTRQIGEHGDRPTGPLGGVADPSERDQMVGDVAVAEVQSDHVETGDHQVFEHLGRVARRTDGRYDLRSAGHLCLSIVRWNCC